MGLTNVGRRSRLHRQGLSPAPQPDAGLVADQQIAVVVVCHENYLCFLPGALHSIRKQIHPAHQCVLVLDGCEPPAWLADWPEWEIVQGKWGSPNPGRNAGLARVRCPWVVWFDADNEMARDQLLVYARLAATADPHDAIWYPDLLYTDAQMHVTRDRHMGEASYWRLRAENYVDTSSLWRTEAVRHVGGWLEDVPNADDYALAAKLTRTGWGICRAEGAHTLMREHNRGRRSEPLWLDPAWYARVRWQIRSHALVTLLAGRHHLLAGYLRWLKQADLPPDTHLVLVDNSADPEFGAKLRKGIPWDRFAGVTVRQVATRPAPGADRWAVLQHVAWLYNATLADVQADAVAIVEDDVMGPRDGLKQLYGAFTRCGCPVGIVSGLYEHPDRRGRACYSLAMDAWGESPALDQVPEQLVQVGYTGAGFAWYTGWLLAEALPALPDPTRYHGWDATVCAEAQRLGHFVMVDGRVRCDHRLAERDT